MKISMNWIGDYVDLTGVDYKDLINKFGLRTAEVEGVEEKGREISGVIAGRILEVNDHPKSNHLHKLKVDTGSEVLDIVCGAPNVKVNMKVALATIGGSVVGMKIEKATIAGEESYGMCCSKDELGFSENEEGIWELDQNIPLGTDIKKAYGLNDTLFEVDNKSLTNRPDLWSHYGIAREIAAILEKPLKPIVTENLQYYTQNGALDIEVYSENCYRYTGIKVGNITKKESPIGVQIRLFYCGMRAINLLADLTNYLMLDVGQPMHAFDGDLVKNIQVTDVKTPLMFKTLDGQDRQVPEGSVVICSNHKPVAIAGVMGGLDSEITSNTKSVVIESATFDAESIRKTAQRLGLRTEASVRYEKSLDPELTSLAIARFVHILRQIDPNITILSALTDVYRRKYAQIRIPVTMEFIEKYMGISMKPEQVGKILTFLGFSVDYNGSNLNIKVPSYRATKDVTIAVDIVEEIARMYGYDNIPQKAVVGKLEPVAQADEHLLEYQTKLILAEKYGFNEIHSYIWNDVKANRDMGIETKGFIKVLNSTVKDNDEIRSELIPTLLKVVNDNKKQNQETAVFEIARVCSGLDGNNLAMEEKHLAVVIASTLKEEKELYFKVKEILEDLTETQLHAQLELQMEGGVNSSLVHPKNHASVFVDGEQVGYISLVHPKILQNIDKRMQIAVLELDFSKFASHQQERPMMKELTKYQTVSLDFNFVVDKDIEYGKIEKTLKGYRTELDYTLKLIDEYEDDEIFAGKRSLTFNFCISSKTHTLIGEEIEAFSQGMVEHAKKKGYSLR